MTMLTMRRFAACMLLIVMLAACDNQPPTAAPTATFSAPTLESTTVFRPNITEPTLPAAIGINNLTTAGLPSGAELPPLAVGTQIAGSAYQTVQLTAADGTLLIGDLYATEIGVRVPGILLLSVDRTGWLDLPLRLQAAGYTVLAMDMRESAALADFQVMIRALSETGTVDPGRIGVVGTEVGADLAVVGCANDMLCDALAMFSPVQQGTVRDGMFGYNPRPLFLSAGTEDAAFAVVESARAVASGEVTFQPVDGSSRGTGLIAFQPSLIETLIAFFDQHLAPIQ